MARTLLALLVALGGALGAARAQTPSPVTWAAALDRTEAAPGGEAALTLRAQIEPGWRMYALGSPVGEPLRVEARAAAGVAAGAPRQPTPLTGYDPNFESDYPYFAFFTELTVPLTVAPNAAGGEREVGAAVTYTVCDDEVCLPANTVDLTATLRVSGPARPALAANAAPRLPREIATAEPADATPEGEATAETDGPGDTLVLPGPGADVADGEAPGPLAATAGPRGRTPASEGAAAPPQGGGLLLGWAGGMGLGAFLLLAVGAGLAALLTPCVFPMVPLTVGYFTHHAADRAHTARLAAVYGAAVVASFTGLGAVMAAVLGAAGATSIAANPVVNLLIGLTLVAFGLSMLGFFELRLPSRLVNAANAGADRRAGYGGALFMGLTLALVSFSCTAPFVGALFAATVEGTWAYPVLGMAVFSAVMAAPFVGFALFPGALSRLPRSGAWMAVLKGTLGFVEIAAALKFLSNADLVWGLGLLPRSLAAALAAVVFALAGLYLLGRLRVGALAEAPGSVGPVRLMGAVGALGLALTLVPGVFGQPLGALDAYLPPADPPAEGVLAQDGAAVGLVWHETRAAAFAEARRTGRPVFVDFTGYTCTNCRFMESTVFVRPEVERRFAERFVLLKLWTDDAENGSELQAYQIELTGQNALPTYAVVAPDGALLGVHRGVATAEAFVAFLDRSPTAPTAPAS